jgi:hypothetical protein
MDQWTDKAKWRDRRLNIGVPEAQTTIELSGLSNVSFFARIAGRGSALRHAVDVSSLRH